MRRRFLPIAAALALLVAAQATIVGALAAGPGQLPAQAATQVVGRDAPNAIPGQYIVVFKKDAPGSSVSAAAKSAKAAGASVTFTYGSAIKGFAGKLPTAALNGITRNPNVLLVEADQRVSIVETQSPATWGLDRIDQRALPLSNSYTYNTTGSGVRAYVIDTGIRTTHSQFGGRAVHGYTAINDGRGSTDCNGHGTHVAGTIGGSTHGVAKGVQLIAVRVLDCAGSGSNSGVIAGVDWVTRQGVRPAVANMSLGGGASSALDTAVNNSVAAGVTYAVAAGNSNANACYYSPARASTAITVGSTTSTDARSSFSNYGSCLDLFAPGSSITSAWHTTDTATNTISGTSMATPHVAGVAALYLQSNPAATTTAVRDTIVNGATTGVVTNPGTGSPNRLLFTLQGGTTPPPAPAPTCSLAEKYSGSLSGAGDYDFHPNGSYFYTSRSGTHRGCLTGPSGTDFDLYLWKWSGSQWVTVAQGIKVGSAEDVSYTGTAGYYTWRVQSYSGSGTYQVQIQRP